MWGLILLAALSAAPFDKGEAVFRPSPDEASVPERFRLGPAVFPYEIGTILETPGYTVRAVRFPSPIVTPEPENNTVHAEYFVPSGSGPGRRRPAVIVLHILGADFALSRYMAARLADRGVAALFVKLPYYGERRPSRGGERVLSARIDPTVPSMRPGIFDVRRAAPW